VIIYACSTNPGKLREFGLAARAGGFTDLEIQPLPNLNQITAPEEPGVTFEENAVLKALYYSKFSSEIVLAEDSGLEVTALGGAPGIYSARFAGDNASFSANNQLVLSRLEGASDRSARFVTVSVLARSGEVLNQAQGTVDGLILERPRGERGFGYDPLFYYPPLSRSFAELSDDEKFAVSARGRSLKTLLHSFVATSQLR
jgi:XTP/dITP diphosphohydrolase